MVGTLQRRLLLLSTLILLIAMAVPALAEGITPFPLQVIRNTAVLEQGEAFGTAEYWNTRDSFIVSLNLDGGWLLKDVQAFVGEDLPPLKKGKPYFKEFTFHMHFDPADAATIIDCGFDEMEFRWGQDRERYVAVHMDLVKLNEFGEVIEEDSAWVLPVNEDGEYGDYYPWPNHKYGGYFTTEFFHPQRGHFIDSPVEGLNYETPTNRGVTDETGGFDFFPGESVQLKIGSVALGEAVADQKISPLDIFDGSDTDDPQVINMARLLQSLDADANPEDRITISPETAACLE